jgi:hypothetical protein
MIHEKTAKTIVTLSSKVYLRKGFSFTGVGQVVSHMEVVLRNYF